MSTVIRTGDWASYKEIGPCQILEIQLRVSAPAECSLRYPAIVDKKIVLKWGYLADVAYNTLEPGARPDLLPGEDDL